MKISSLKSRIIIFTIIIITPIVTSNIMSLVASKKINENYSIMLDKLNTVNEIKNLLDTSFNSFNEYFQISSSSSKDEFENNCILALAKLEYLESNSDIASKYILKDLLNTVRSYKAQAEKTLELFNNHGAIDAYYDEYVLTKEITSYCNSFITKLDESYIDYNNKIYSKSREREKNIYKLQVIYIFLTLTLSIVYTIFFTGDILKKLRVLVVASQKVSAGDFAEITANKANVYELDLLYDTFNEMIKAIKGYINSIKENASLEAKVREDEMTLLKYENALKLSQLKILQSQINPHFLFNTLNCINQTAIKEKAYETEELITSVSAILRYSLSRMNRNATLEEEISIVQQYIFIQKRRYDERLKFSIEVNSDINKIEVPGLTLQPFVENAFIHGIEPKEDGGDITIKIYDKDNYCNIIIQDTGCGIDDETISKIISNEGKSEHIGHTTGLGIKSVVERLELLYEEKNIFSVESKKGKGTKILLKIPIKELKKIC